jgi:hypothetical protein
MLNFSVTNSKGWLDLKFTISSPPFFLFFASKQIFVEAVLTTPKTIEGYPLMVMTKA